MMQALVTLAFVGLVEAISYMVVAPSLIFYVLQSGGTKEQYGLILSIFSFSSFLTKPILGAWIDGNGNKFRVPYFTCILIGTVGGLLYFMASFYQDKPSTAIGLIFAGRFLGGVAAACQALGYAYLAAVVPHEKQTSTNSLLSLVRIVGMASGPGFNVLLARIDKDFTLFGKVRHLDPLNSVGLFLAGLNIVALAAFYFFLPEPPEKEPKKPRKSSISQDENPTLKIIRACFKLEIVLPIFTLLVVNSNFQLIETGFAPAASHALGWGPVETSAVLGMTSILIMVNMILVMFLSSRKVPDEVLIGIGSTCWIIGGTLLYFNWVEGAQVWQFVVPVVICISGFPFIAPSNRSKYTRAVDSIPELDGRQGSMQALLSMFASAAGFLTPGIVAAFVLRSGDEVDASKHHRELQPWALYAAVLPLLVIVGLFALRRKEKKIRLQKEESLGETDERTRLVAGKVHEGRSYSHVMVQEAFSNRTEMNRRASVEVAGTGIPLPMTASEVERRDELYKQLKEMDWDSLEEDEAP